MEEFSMNAWPALRTYVLDGWILRFAEGYTKRSNSISALYEGGEQDLADKIQKCEDLYRQAGQPVIFKMTPFVPSELDGLLEERGYRYVEPSLVMELDDLSAVPEPSAAGEIRIDDAVSRAWVDRLAVMNGMSAKAGDTTMKLFEQPLLATGFFTLYEQGAAVACGIGVTDRQYVGLFDIVTHPEHRNRGWGEQLIRHILKWGRERGTSGSCLAVLRDNPPANRLYEKLGYRASYPYGYRVKS
jgi:ribosomal protein S18 acetylase RimI-like enzyme